MKPYLQTENFTFLGLELFFTILIILSSFLIYHYTRDFYKLSEHKGISYFRKGFFLIFLAHLSMLLVLIPKIFLIFFDFFSFEFFRLKFFLSFFILFYFTGIGFLFSSMYSKYIKEYQIYLLSILIFLISFLFRTKLFIMIYSSLLIILLGIVSFYKLKKTKKKTFSHIYIIYILIFLSWVLNIFSRVFFDIFLGRLVNVLFTALIFLYILYIIIKKFK